VSGVLTSRRRKHTCFYSLIRRGKHVGEPRLRPRGRQVRNGISQESRDSSPANRKRPTLACIAPRGATVASPGTASSASCVPTSVVHLPSVECATGNLAVRAKQEGSTSAVAGQHSPNYSQDRVVSVCPLHFNIILGCAGVVWVVVACQPHRLLDIAVVRTRRT